MRTQWLIWLCLLLGRTAVATGGPADSLQVTLSAIKQEFLVGEAIRILVQVKNVGSEPVKARELFVDDGEPDIGTFYSRDGDTFRQFHVFHYVDWDRSRDLLELAPGESWYYAMRLLYSAEVENRLAFGELGDYWLKVHYLYWPARQEDLKRLESNTIRIRVMQPDGHNLQIWENLRNDACLRFLQTGSLPLEERQEIPADIARLLVSAPDSAYHPAMRWALGRYYYQIRTTGTPLPNLEDIENGRLYRKALGIYLQDPTDRLAGDERLFTRRVVVRFEEMTPVEEVLAAVEKQTGVPLTCDPALRKGRFSCLEMDQSLAEFMWRVFASPGDKTWVRDGRGYHLVPVTETDKQPGGPKHAGPPP